MKANKRPRSFGTHDGTFHADEVTACALLLLFNCIDEDKIVRSREIDVLGSCEYVCDVSGIYDPKRKLFDHHQAEYQGELSSAGMVLLYLKETGKISPKEYDFFNSSIILGVDAHDNGKDLELHGVCTYSHIISNFTPIKQDVPPEELEKAFFEAVHFAQGQLSRMLQRYHYIQSCRQIVADAMASSREYLLFDHNIPWMDTFFELDGEKHPALFVIMPSGKHWKLRGIPPNTEHRMSVRLPLPKAWAGLQLEELKRISGIPGAIFCHKGRFISVWETKEDAMMALDTVLRAGRAKEGCADGAQHCKCAKASGMK